MSDLLAGAEKVEFPDTPTEGDIATFMDEGAREADFQEAMMGEQHAEGGRHDLQPRGFSSQNLEVEQQQMMHPPQVELAPEQGANPLDAGSNYVQQPQPQEDVEYWKKQYGESENKVGELRSQMMEVMNQMTQMQQQQAAHVEVPDFFGPQPQPAQYTAPVGQQQPQFDPSTLPRLVNKPDGEPMMSEEVDELLRTTVAPVLFQLEQQNQQAMRQAQEANRRMFEAEKARIGITPVEERQLVAQNPWLSGMRDPQMYLQALGDAKKRQDMMAQARPAPAHPTPSTTPQQQQMVRQRTFVEQGRQQSGPAQADSSTASPQQLFAQAWAETMHLPFRERAAKQRELMRRGGMKQFSGYRDPQILTS